MFGESERRSRSCLCLLLTSVSPYRHPPHLLPGLLDSLPQEALETLAPLGRRRSWPRRTLADSSERLRPAGSSVWPEPPPCLAEEKQEVLRRPHSPERLLRLLYC